MIGLITEKKIHCLLKLINRLKNLNNIKVANIIEESKLGGPQIRIVNIANALKDIVETTVILPKENSDNFITLLKKLKVNFKSFSLSRITKNYKVALKYIFFSPIDLNFFALCFMTFSGT